MFYFFSPEASKAATNLAFSSTVIGHKGIRQGPALKGVHKVTAALTGIGLVTENKDFS
jgi:hypothetical protein